MENIGIDVHKRESQISVITETGEILELRIATRRERFAEVLAGRPRARILIEASTESEWVARCLGRGSANLRPGPQRDDAPETPDLVPKDPLSRRLDPDDEAAPVAEVVSLRMEFHPVLAGCRVRSGRTNSS